MHGVRRRGGAKTYGENYMLVMFCTTPPQLVRGVGYAIAGSALNTGRSPQARRIKRPRLL